MARPSPPAASPTIRRRSRAQRAADPSVDHDNPLEEVYEDQLLCADLVVLNKTDLLSRRRRDARGGARSRGAMPRAREGRHRAAKAASIPPSLLGLRRGAEDDLAARPSHHDTEEEHDHDDFDTFIVDVPPLADPDALRRPPRRARRARTTCCA